MSKRSHRIVLLLERLYTLDTALGGNEKSRNAPKPSKEFDQLLMSLKEDIETIVAQQQDRDKRIKKFGNDSDAIQLGIWIREGILQVESSLKQLEKTLLRQLKKPKKYDPKEIETRVVELKLVKVALKATKQKEFGYEEQEFKGVSLKELQNQVFDPSREQGQVQELSKDEYEALARWDLNDQHMDEQLDQIINGLDQLNLNARMIGDVLINYILQNRINIRLSQQID